MVRHALLAATLALTTALAAGCQTGACCTDGGCQVVSGAECTRLDGTYLGDNVPCSECEGGDTGDTGDTGEPVRSWCLHEIDRTSDCTIDGMETGDTLCLPCEDPYAVDQEACEPFDSCDVTVDGQSGDCTVALSLLQDQCTTCPSEDTWQAATASCN